MWYLFGKDNKCYGMADYKPDVADIEERNEVIIESNTIFSDITKLTLENNIITEIVQPVAEPTKEEKLAALDAVYQPQFAGLAQSLGVASLDGNQAAITGIKEDYAALKAEYTAKMEALG